VHSKGRGKVSRVGARARGYMAMAAFFRRGWAQQTTANSTEQNPPPHPRPTPSHLPKEVQRRVIAQVNFVVPAATARPAAVGRDAEHRGGQVAHSAAHPQAVRVRVQVRLRVRLQQHHRRCVGGAQASVEMLRQAALRRAAPAAGAAASAAAGGGEVEPPGVVEGADGNAAADRGERGGRGRAKRVSAAQKERGSVDAGGGARSFAAHVH
jgi:hypothetical protein